MFVKGHGEHYLKVGKSAMRNIFLAMISVNKTDLHSILDFGCGYGRVLRILKYFYPNAQLSACDLERAAVDFCRRTFKAKAIYSHENPAHIPLEDQYDLIWVGSVFTHLHSSRWNGFLKLLSSHLQKNGILSFSVHGQNPYQTMSQGIKNYGLDPVKLPELLHDYKTTGFGYLDYPNIIGFGVALSSPAWVCAQVNELDNIKLVSYSETAWDNHHDIVACVKY
jgi:SAM-dependent methyltransferase